MFFRKSSAISTDPAKIKMLIERGVEDVFVKESLEANLRSGKQLRVKLGIDPTGRTIHIGRAVVLRKLRAFQDLGHKIILIVGDFTALIGDPSDKLEKRPMLTEAKIKENLKDYKKILGKIIDINNVEFVYNSTWLSKLTFKEIAQLAEAFTVQQMSARRNFKDRIDKGEEISLREFLYPLMQGYDSVMVDADIEIGGFDQLFNVKAGRVVQKHYGKKEQDVITFQMLEGTDGRKMSTSWGNVINITDEANDMYGKIMSVRDDLLIKYFLLCTDVADSEIEGLKQQLASGTNPKEIKMRLAREIVTIYHSKKSAELAEQNFTNTFSKGGVPDEIETIQSTTGLLLADVLVEKKIISSKTDWRRLVTEGAITETESNTKITDPFFKIEKAGTYKIGKRRFVKIEIK